MRLWSIHPKYLDRQGLIALWREALLAQAVLRGQTRGYRNHPQLDRFRDSKAPLSAISLYLKAICDEAETRGYSFDKNKIKPARRQITLLVTFGQINYEWKHLMKKLRARNTSLYRKHKSISNPDPHSLFKVRTGNIEPWERKHNP